MKNQAHTHSKYFHEFPWFVYVEISKIINLICLSVSEAIAFERYIVSIKHKTETMLGQFYFMDICHKIYSTQSINHINGNFIFVVSKNRNI